MPSLLFIAVMMFRGRKHEVNTTLRFNGFVQTMTYAYPNPGIHLDTAVAISGAAVSPNMGYHSNPATAFLMTVFGVRLGWWLRIRVDWMKMERSSMSPMDSGERHAAEATCHLSMAIASLSLFWLVKSYSAEPTTRITMCILAMAATSITWDCMNSCAVAAAIL